jgi:hypothetical protein
MLVVGDIVEAFTDAKAKSIPPNTKMMIAIRAGLRGMAVKLYT